MAPGKAALSCCPQTQPAQSCGSSARHGQSRGTTNTATPPPAHSRVRGGGEGGRKIKLTNIRLFVGFDDFSQFEISCNDGHLKERRQRGERLGSSVPALAAADRARWTSNSCFPRGRGASDCSASAHPVGSPEVKTRSGTAGTAHGDGPRSERCRAAPRRPVPLPPGGDRLTPARS